LPDRKHVAPESRKTDEMPGCRTICASRWLGVISAPYSSHRSQEPGVDLQPGADRDVIESLAAEHPRQTIIVSGGRTSNGRGGRAPNRAARRLSYAHAARR
jgi:hypothetical protein